jgi:hypothetical protein
MPPPNLADVVRLADGFLAVGEGTIWCSTDGRFWQPRSAIGPYGIGELDEDQDTYSVMWVGEQRPTSPDSGSGETGREPWVVTPAGAGVPLATPAPSASVPPFGTTGPGWHRMDDLPPMVGEDQRSIPGRWRRPSGDSDPRVLASLGAVAPR